MTYKMTYNKSLPVPHGRVRKITPADEEQLARDFLVSGEAPGRAIHPTCDDQGVR